MHNLHLLTFIFLFYKMIIVFAEFAYFSVQFSVGYQIDCSKVNRSYT
jgi:hypothetical protein